MKTLRHIAILTIWLSINSQAQTNSIWKEFDVSVQKFAFENDNLAGFRVDNFYLSQNNGESWRTSEIVVGKTANGSNLYANIENVIVRKNKIYLFSLSTTYISEDLGTTWKKGGDIDGSSMSVVYNDKYIYQGSYGGDGYGGIGGVFKSSDDGKSWSLISKSISSKKVGALLLNGNDVYAQSFDKGLFKSTDNGNTWISINDKLTGNGYKLVSNGSKLFAGLNSKISMMNLSNNEVQPFPFSDSLKGKEIKALAISDNILFIGTTNGFYYYSISNGEFKEIKGFEKYCPSRNSNLANIQSLMVCKNSLIVNGKYSAKISSLIAKN